MHEGKLTFCYLLSLYLQILFFFSIIQWKVCYSETYLKLKAKSGRIILKCIVGQGCTHLAKIYKPTGGSMRKKGETYQISY